MRMKISCTLMKYQTQVFQNKGVILNEALSLFITSYNNDSWRL